MNHPSQTMNMKHDDSNHRSSTSAPIRAPSKSDDSENNNDEILHVNMISSGNDSWNRSSWTKYGLLQLMITIYALTSTIRGVSAEWCQPFNGDQFQTIDNEPSAQCPSNDAAKYDCFAVTEALCCNETVAQCTDAVRIPKIRLYDTCVRGYQNSFATNEAAARNYIGGLCACDGPQCNNLRDRVLRDDFVPRAAVVTLKEQFCDPQVDLPIVQVTLKQFNDMSGKFKDFSGLFDSNNDNERLDKECPVIQGVRTDFANRCGAKLVGAGCPNAGETAKLQLAKEKCIRSLNPDAFSCVTTSPSAVSSLLPSSSSEPLVEPSSAISSLANAEGGRPSSLTFASPPSDQPTENAIPPPPISTSAVAPETPSPTSPSNVPSSEPTGNVPPQISSSGAPETEPTSSALPPPPPPPPSPPPSPLAASESSPASQPTQDTPPPAPISSSGAPETEPTSSALPPPPPPRPPAASESSLDAPARSSTSAPPSEPTGNTPSGGPPSGPPPGPPSGPPPGSPTSPTPTAEVEPTTSPTPLESNGSGNNGNGGNGNNGNGNGNGVASLTTGLPTQPSDVTGPGSGSGSGSDSGPRAEPGGNSRGPVASLTSRESLPPTPILDIPIGNTEPRPSNAPPILDIPGTGSVAAASAPPSAGSIFNVTDSAPTSSTNEAPAPAAAPRVVVDNVPGANPNTGTVVNGSTSSDIPVPSTQEGRRLNNIVLTLPGTNPNSPGSFYNRSAVANLPSGLPIILVRLNIACGSACIPGDPLRIQFMEQFVNDTLMTFEERGLKPNKDTVQILNMVALRDEKTGKDCTVVQFTIYPMPDGTGTNEALKAFKDALDDPNSYLRSKGKLTRYLDPEVFNVDVTSTVSNDAVSSNGKMSPTTIALISIGCYVAVMIAFIVGYRRYVNRVKQDEINAKLHNAEMKSWYYKSLKINGSNNSERGLMEFDEEDPSFMMRDSNMMTDNTIEGFSKFDSHIADTPEEGSRDRYLSGGDDSESNLDRHSRFSFNTTPKSSRIFSRITQNRISQAIWGKFNRRTNVDSAFDPTSKRHFSDDMMIATEVDQDVWDPEIQNEIWQQQVAGGNGEDMFEDADVTDSYPSRYAYGHDYM